MPSTSPGRYSALGTDDLVSGEGVAIELPVAGVLHRSASGLIDVVVSVVALCLGGLAIGGALGGTSEAVQQTAIILLVVGSLVLLPFASETVLRGRTAGKLALGLRTVRDDGGPIRARHALVRALVGFVEVWLVAGLPAFVTALVHPRGKRLGDVAAGTYVVTTRRSVRLDPPAPMPWRLQRWAVRADIAALSDGLAIAARQYLARRHTMIPERREALARELATSLLAHVSPAPPPVPAEEVVAAVVAERRRRDAIRLGREQRLRDRVVGPDPLGR